MECAGTCHSKAAVLLGGLPNDNALGTTSFGCSSWLKAEISAAVRIVPLMEVTGTSSPTLIGAVSLLVFMTCGTANELLL
jgi:hypothetical protein